MTALQKLRPVAKFRVHVSQQRKGTKVLLPISRNTPLFALRMVKTAVKKDGAWITAKIRHKGGAASFSQRTEGRAPPSADDRASNNEDGRKA